MGDICEREGLCVSMVVLAFGLKNALAKFQQVMDKMIIGLSFVRCYIDDMIIFSLTPRDHMQHLHEVFDQLKEHNFKLHIGKCKFCSYSSGVLRSHDGLGFHKAKVKVISHVP